MKIRTIYAIVVAFVLFSELSAFPVFWSHQYNSYNPTGFAQKSSTSEINLSGTNYVVYAYSTGGAPSTIWMVYTVPLTGTWRPLVAESVSVLGDGLSVWTVNNPSSTPSDYNPFRTTSATATNIATTSANGMTLTEVFRNSRINTSTLPSQPGVTYLIRLNQKSSGNSAATFVGIRQAASASSLTSIQIRRGGSKVADGTTAASGATATIVGGSLGSGHTISYVFGQTSSPAPGSYPVTITPTVRNASNAVVTTSYRFSYDGTYEITPANTQVIDFAPLPDRTYGSAAFNISATASSGLPVTFSVINGAEVVSLVNNTVTIVATGSVTIRASQAGNATWAEATPIDRTFNVTPVAIPVNLSNLTHTFDQTPKAATATATLP